MEAMPCNACGEGAARGLSGRRPPKQPLPDWLARGLRRPVYASVVEDIATVIDAWRTNDIDGQTMRTLLADRLNALEHLADGGPVVKGLEHAEAALVEAMVQADTTIKFERIKGVRQPCGRGASANASGRIKGVRHLLADTPAP